MAKPDIEAEVAKVTSSAQLVIALADADSRIAHFTGGRISKLTDKIANGRKIATIRFEQALSELLGTEEAETTLVAADKARAEIQEKHDAEARLRASGNIPPSHKPRAAVKAENAKGAPNEPPAPKGHAKVPARAGAAADKPGGE